MLFILTWSDFLYCKLSIEPKTYSVLGPVVLDIIPIKYKWELLLHRIYNSKKLKIENEKAHWKEDQGIQNKYGNG